MFDNGGEVELKIEFEIDDKIVECFISSAQDELRENAKKHVSEIIDEARRIETGLNVGTQSFITPSHVKQAVMKSKSNPSRKPGWWHMILQVVASVGALFAGGLFDIEAFKKDTILMLAFIIISLISTVCLIATLFADYYKR